ncbi:MAG: hypothetical protein FJ387_18930 [Verrucomicrobia bacterium]|nr:hypothetical protein [Verrucomicrobiota bacterium]
MNPNLAVSTNWRRPFRFHRALALTLVWFSASAFALAQPRILTQPRNVAVPAGQDAQFRVSATGVAPLAYQWRFNGTPLEGATTNSLSLANVELWQLGCYDVTVSNSAGEITSAPAWLLLANRWTELVYFGSSEGMDKCGGGPWNDHLARRLGVTLRNYASGLANSAGVASQIATYLRSYTPNSNTLVAFWTGGPGNDMLGKEPPELAASNRVGNVRLLAAAGARQFLILRFYPPELMPYFRNLGYPTNELALRYDVLLDQGLEPLRAEYGLTVFRPDMFALFTAIYGNPTAYGFKNPPATDFWCDGMHTTLAVHRLVSEECYRCLTPPLRITLIARSPEPSGDVVQLQWQGGSPPFCVQYCEDLQQGLWQSSFSWFWTTVWWVPAKAHEFMRIVHLGQ